MVLVSVTAGADGNWWGEKWGGGVVCLRVRGQRSGGRVTLPLLKELSSGRVSVTGPPSSHSSPTDHNPPTTTYEGRRVRTGTDHSFINTNCRRSSSLIGSESHQSQMVAFSFRNLVHFLLNIQRRVGFYGVFTEYTGGI